MDDDLQETILDPLKRFAAMSAQHTRNYKTLASGYFVPYIEPYIVACREHHYYACPDRCNLYMWDSIVEITEAS